MPAATTRTRLLRRLRRARLDPAPDVVEGLVVYYDLLRRWNEKINLTALPEGDEAVDRLLVEPVLAARLLPEPVALVVDIGSGGGSPAIPLKLVAPAIKLWMVESKTRKAAFLREAVRQLGLDGVVVESQRVEALIGRPELFGLADVVTIRAVRADLRMLGCLQMLLGPQGQLFFFSKLGEGARLMLPPQLTLLGEVPLLAALQTCLVRLGKRDQSRMAGVG